MLNKTTLVLVLLAIVLAENVTNGFWISRPGDDSYPQFVYMKRSKTDGNNERLEEVIPASSDDEYAVVSPKRSALLLDRIMVALQKAVGEDRDKGRRLYYPDESSVGLQRRGQEKGRLYWRCYFNAVTCFKRK